MWCNPCCRNPGFVVVALTIIGCGESSNDLEIARQSVVVALEAWKQGGTPAQLSSHAPPIEFHDNDWRDNAKLRDYEIRKTYRDTDGRPRCAVSLSLERRRGEVVTVQHTYQVNTDPNIVIDRDPYS